MSTLLKRI